MPASLPNSSSTSSMTIKDGLLSAAIWLASPNYNVRPKGLSIDAIVVHNISLPPNEFGACDTNGTHYVKALFTNQLKVQKYQRIYLSNVMALSLSSSISTNGRGMLGGLATWVDLNVMIIALASSLKGRILCPSPLLNMSS